MRKHTKTWITALGLLFFSSWVSAAPLPTSVLANDAAIYEVRAGTYGELLPDLGEIDPEQSVVVLDVTRPGEATQRFSVPATAGVEVEASARMLYSRETGLLNVLWESRVAGEVSVLLARFDGTEWSPVEEVYFDSAGVGPAIAATRDEFHVDLDGGTSIDADRQILHLVWQEETDGQLQLGYSPIILLNGVYVGTRETLTLPHLNPNANGVGGASFPGTFQVAVQDGDFDRVTLTFASSASQLATTYDIQVTPMEMVHFGELIRDYVLDAEGFEPRDIAGFADQLGVHIVDIGHRRTHRSHVFLTPPVIDFVASGVTRFVLDHGASYGVHGQEDLANDLQQRVLELSSSLYAPAAGSVAQGGPKSRPASALSVMVIDVGELVGDEAGPIPSHVLELRFAVEIALPDSNGSEMDLFASDDGRRFLATWLDAVEPDLLWYVESNLDGTWSETRSLHLNEGLNLEQARSLLEQRIR